MLYTRYLHLTPRKSNFKVRVAGSTTHIVYADRGDLLSALLRDGAQW